MNVRIKSAKIISGFIYKTRETSDSEADFTYFRIKLSNDTKDKNLIKDKTGRIIYKGILNIPKNLKLL